MIDNAPIPPPAPIYTHDLGNAAEMKKLNRLLTRIVFLLENIDRNTATQQVPS